MTTRSENFDNGGFDLVPNNFPSVIPPRPAGGGVSEGLHFLRIIQQLRQDAGKALHIAGPDTEAIFSVDDKIRNGAKITADDGQSGAHGFDV